MRIAVFCRLVLALLVAVSTAPAAQSRDGNRVVHGTTINGADSSPLGDVAVVALGVHAAHTTSVPGGHFALELPAGPVRLLAARIGFAPETLAVAATIDTIVVLLRAAAIELEPLVVGAQPGLSAASSRAIRELDLRLRPRESAQELPRLAPGLVITQHAGGGKAEQLSTRSRCRPRHGCGRLDGRGAGEHGVARAWSGVRRSPLPRSRSCRARRGEEGTSTCYADDSVTSRRERIGSLSRRRSPPPAGSWWVKPVR
jgi:hypothetical protein